MNWQLFPQFFATGILNGGPIALIALGIVLVYKSSEVFNFAHGQMLLVGAMTTWWFSSDDFGLGWHWAPAVLAALLVSILLGLAIERLALRPLTGQSLLSIILMTLAISQVLQGLIVLVFGATQRNFPVIFPVDQPYKIQLPITYGGNALVIILRQNLVWSFITAMLAVILLWAFFQYTRMGLAMRATAENHETAQSVGIRIRSIFGLSWAIAGIIATLGGVLIATASGLDLSLPIVVLAAFPAVLLGGLESIPGAVLGGLIGGLSKEIVALPNERFFLGPDTAQLIRNAKDIVPYLILLLVLFIRPDGLFGQRRIERV